MTEETPSVHSTSVPLIEDLLNPVLKALRELGGSAGIEELVERVIADLQLPTEVIEVPREKGTGTKLEYRLAWARTWLKNKGLITNSARGIWALTPKGMEVQEVDPNEVKRRGSSQVGDLPSLVAETPPQGDTQPESQSPREWKLELLETLQQMSPAAFEHICKRILRESGFHHVKVTGCSGDGGIDGVGVLRLAGILSFQVVFQCKRYKGSVGPGIVRDFRGAMVGRADKGILMTTGEFTRDAKREAARDGAPPVELIGGEQLVEMLKELRIGVKVEEKRLEVVEIDSEYFSAFEGNAGVG